MTKHETGRSQSVAIEVDTTDPFPLRGNNRIWRQVIGCLVFGLGMLAVFAMNGIHAATLLVSNSGVDTGDCVASTCATIGFAMDNAFSGDEVRVSAGVYPESVSLKSGVRLIGDAGARLVAPLGSPAVNIAGAGPGSLLEGFKIDGNSVPAVVSSNSAARISRNDFAAGSVEGSAAAIVVFSSNLVIENNLFRNLIGGAGVIAVLDSQGEVPIVNNTFYNNNNFSGAGQVININEGSPSVLIQNNIFAKNGGSGMSSMIQYDSNPPTINNNVFSLNWTDYISDSGLVVASFPIENLNALTFAANNIEADPQFVAATEISETEDLHLTSLSPAIDQGETANSPTTDFDGDVRPLGAGIDIGFDEFAGGVTPTAQCADGEDNDGDGLIDLADPDCSSAEDNDESDAPPPQGNICSATATSVQEIQEEVDASAITARRKKNLTATLNSIQAALDSGDFSAARGQTAQFVRLVTNSSNLPANNEGRLPFVEAASLICGAANLYLQTDQP
jgi:hypothetical protein